MATTTIKVNGKEQKANGRITIAEFIDGFGLKPLRCLVEYNGRVLKHEEFKDILLKNGDVLEIMSIVAGG